MPFAMPPGLRIPYDTDGTVGLIRRSATLGGDLYDIHPTALAAMNSTFGGGMVVPNTLWADADTFDRAGIGTEDPSAAFFFLQFPVPIRLRGLFLSSERGFSDSSSFYPTAALQAEFAADYNRVEVSMDSTNGLDGTWFHLGDFKRGTIPRVSAVGANVTTGATSSATSRPVKDVFRNLFTDSGVGIHDLSGSGARNIKSMRIFPLYYDSRGVASNDASGRFTLHLYGEPDTYAFGSNYLQGWRSDSDMRLGGATLSWGDVPLGSSEDKAFRIKNQSDTDTANDIHVYCEDLFQYPTPSPALQILFSIDGGVTWLSELTIASLGPGTISSEIRLRRVTPMNAVLTTWSPKIRFDTGSWS